MFFINPDAPPLKAPDTGIVIRLCIACRREFNLNEVDLRIDRDKPWGRRDWDEGAPAATSCLVPVDFKDEILDKLRAHADVIFVEDSVGILERIARRSAAPRA
jgi:hypothetical protein